MTDERATPATPARETLPELDPVIHPQARLQIMTTLAALADGERISFTRLQEFLALSPGNLSTHLAKLEEAGYVKLSKAFRGRRPVTWVTITARGRAAFTAYLEALRAYLPQAGAAKE